MVLFLTVLNAEPGILSSSLLTTKRIQPPVPRGDRRGRPPCEKGRCPRGSSSGHGASSRPAQQARFPLPSAGPGVVSLPPDTPAALQSLPVIASPPSARGFPASRHFLRAELPWAALQSAADPAAGGSSGGKATAEGEARRKGRGGRGAGGGGGSWLRGFWQPCHQHHLPSLERPPKSSGSCVKASRPLTVFSATRALRAPGPASPGRELAGPGCPEPVPPGGEETGEESPGARARDP